MREGEVEEEEIAFKNENTRLLEKKDRYVQAASIEIILKCLNKMKHKRRIHSYFGHQWPIFKYHELVGTVSYWDLRICMDLLFVMNHAYLCFSIRIKRGGWLRAGE